MTIEIPKLSTIGDKMWRMQNLYKIRDKKRNLIPFRPNRIQWVILNRFLEEKKLERPLKEFILKFRQGGVSTLCALWHLDDTIFHRNTVTGILADKRESLGDLWEIPRLAHQNLPTVLQPRLGDDSKTSMTFPDINSKMFVSLSIKSTGIHNLHISEWCFCEDEAISQSLGATSPDTNITGETTPDRVGGDGYITYHDGKMGQNGYHVIFIPWFWQDEYRIAVDGAGIIRMEEEKKLDLDDEQVMFRRVNMQKFKRDFLKYYPEDDVLCWLMAGSKFFDQKKILVLLKEAKEERRENPPAEETDDYVMWKEPKLKHKYVGGADTAEGIGGDYSVLKILDLGTKEEVFRYRAHAGVDLFYRVCDMWGRRYNNMLLGVERNQHGHAVLLGLRETMKYPNLYEEEKTRGQGLRKWGWMTTETTRPILLDQLKFSIEGDSQDDESNFQPELKICDEELLKECLTFQDNKGKFEAASGYHDDVIFATGIAWQLYIMVMRGHNYSSIIDRIFLGDKRESTV